MTTFPLDMLTELQINGVWTKVPTYERDAVTIEHGRPERATKTDPGQLSITVNNRDGRFSPRNPMSPYYGLIGRNTRVRFSVPGGTSRLELDGGINDIASTPDHSSLDITGDLDLRWEGEADWYASAPQTLIGKWGAVGNRSYIMFLENGNMIAQVVRGGAGTSPFAVYSLPVLPARAALRATVDVDNGAGGLTIRLYWATSITGPWTLFGEGTIATPLAIQTSTAPLAIAPDWSTVTPPRTPVVGRVYRAQVRAGIDGTIVASPDFTAQAPGTTSFTDSAGRPWTLSGTAVIRDREDLFVGEASEWPQHWTPDGADAWVPLVASGILRRLGQGKKALQSTLRRRIPSYKPLAYWPMEEGKTATQAYSPIPGVSPLRLTHARWANDEGLPASDPLPVLDGKTGAPSELAGSVPNRTGLSGWSAQWLHHLDTGPATRRTIMRVLSTGTVREWLVQSGADGTNLIGLDPDGTTLVSQGIATGSALWGQWVRTRLSIEQEGTNVRYTIAWTVAAAGSATIFWTGTVAGTIGRPTSVASPVGGYSTDLTGMALGHISVWDVADTTAYDRAVDAWAGDTAWNRMLRLAQEEGLPLAAIPGPGNSERVGPQTSDTLLTLLQAAADADGGLLLEDRTRIGLVYRERSSMYSQTPKLTLSYDQAPGLAAPLEPVDDDTAIRNDRTVKRSGGSEGRAVLEDGPLSVQDPPDGVGRYDDSVTLSLYEDEQTEPIAYWRLHLGTVDGPRYPTVRIMLHKAPELIPAVLSLTEGDLVRITGLPAYVGFGDVDLMVDGIHHEMRLMKWTVSLSCSPAAPWQVGVVDDTVLGIVDTDGSELAAGVDTDDTTLSVAVTDGPVWRYETDVAIRVGGEVMTVTGISGTSSPQTFTVTRSVNGVVKPHAAGTDVRLATPTIVAL